VASPDAIAYFGETLVKLLQDGLGDPLGLPDSERTPPCAYAHARAREKSLKNFRLVPLRRRYGQRCRALAVIIPIMPTSELVWLVRQ